MGKKHLVIGFTVYQVPYEMIVPGKSPWKCPNMSGEWITTNAYDVDPLLCGWFMSRALWNSRLNFQGSPGFQGLFDPGIRRGCPEMMDERGWRNSWNHISAILPDFTGLAVLRIGWTNFFSMNILMNCFSHFWHGAPCFETVSSMAFRASFSWTYSW